MQEVYSLSTDYSPGNFFKSAVLQKDIKTDVVNPTEKTIEILKKRGYLTEKNPHEEENFFKKIANEIHDINRKPGYIFVPTYDCNLRCSYCFQDHMRTSPDFNHLLHPMDRSMLIVFLKQYLRLTLLMIYQAINRRIVT